MGIGYFYDGLSGPLEGFAAPIAALQCVHGGEFYYNAEVTPWFHLTRRSAGHPTRVGTSGHGTGPGNAC